MKDLKNIKSKLVEQVVAQLDNLDQVNTQELGEAIDMIKDISEAIYYCSIVKSMNTNNNIILKRKLKIQVNLLIQLVTGLKNFLNVLLQKKKYY